ncbi:hypothetical protein SEA_SOYO_90 [Mycobacterium phage SoYo]|uniref:Uncharacterized protein n=29 Tax=Microwolfvirus TaxID=2942894 RepID=A0A0A7S2P7_9CAUD|nr:hypothetical protein PBI_BXZ2_88 [Mycobacterium phage Bxz2]YP_009195190.1 hypothetical protein AVT20_gp07 [Mycobacterium phage Tiffany]YP_009198518.1 hypothetical protein AVV34_gp07 [Mycobacterium phage MarQuardt]YP_009219157.1 hypothetical protein AVV42_gp07 [Mycobacterium phage Anubis]YP_009635678.1 hypothetical protein FGG58_gp07 [Mycobacterium phage JHC117]AEK07748.1 hypothetical protein VIX_88 [Mycobacterium phage Vix]AGK87287.1 hypothetical protein PBI_METHUSELAH_86 [Mycobacterium ph
MAKGQTFQNGQGLHSHGFNWAETLTVVRKDPMSYGVERYLVRDRYGRHGYAY